MIQKPSHSPARAPCPIALAAALAAALAGAPGGALAFTLETDVPDLRLQWDTTVKYSAAARVRDRAAVLVANPNLDDGDRNFDKGLISNRLDLLTEADLRWRQWGARISGAGWVDAVYRGQSDNDSRATWNVTSRPYREFAEGTRKLHGRKGELLDAFVSGKFELGDDANLTMRAGRHTLQWGESLFFGANAIAGGMAPVDVVKALSVPNTPFKELLRPVGQVSAQVQLGSNLALGAYAQYRWEPTRLPGTGSYFSVADPTPSDGEAFLLGPGVPPARHAPDVRARNSGQGGLQLRWRPAGLDTDLGLYAIRYHDKTPQQFITAVPLPPGAPVPFVPVSYHYEYAEGINAFGVSATRSIGDHNVAAELSVRTHAPLVSSGSLNVPALRISHSYARGTTWHANFNVLSALGPSFIARESSVLAEIALNYTQSVKEHPESVDPNTKRWGAALRVAFEPVYRQVLDGLDIGVPVGLGYTPEGRSSAGGALGPHRGGDFSLGLNGTYLDVWRFSLSFTHFFGPAAPFLDSANHQTFKQTSKDRDFVALSVRRTF